MQRDDRRVFTGPPIVQSMAVVLVTLIFFVSIWSLKGTVQTEAANMVDACRVVADELKRGADDGG